MAYDIKICPDKIELSNPNHFFSSANCKTEEQQTSIINELHTHADLYHERYATIMKFRDELMAVNYIDELKCMDDYNGRFTLSIKNNELDVLINKPYKPNNKKTMFLRNLLLKKVLGMSEKYTKLQKLYDQRLADIQVSFKSCVAELVVKHSIINDGCKNSSTDVI